MNTRSQLLDNEIDVLTSSCAQCTHKFDMKNFLLYCHLDDGDREFERRESEQPREIDRTMDYVDLIST
jgi:hypothetical protein